VLLCLAPSLDANRQGTGRMDGSDIAAVAVTTGAIAALARVSSLLFPRYGLATAAGLVLLVAAGVRAMPVAWRRGPVIGGSLVGSVVAAVAGFGAVRGGVAVLEADRPLWHADLTSWSAHVSGTFGPQIPLACCCSPPPPRSACRSPSRTRPVWSASAWPPSPSRRPSTWPGGHR